MGGEIPASFLFLESLRSLTTVSHVQMTHLGKGSLKSRGCPGGDRAEGSAGGSRGPWRAGGAPEERGSRPQAPEVPLWPSERGTPWDFPDETYSVLRGLSPAQQACCSEHPRVAKPLVVPKRFPAPKLLPLPQLHLSRWSSVLDHPPLSPTQYLVAPRAHPVCLS